MITSVMPGGNTIGIGLFVVAAVSASTARADTMTFAADDTYIRLNEENYAGTDTLRLHTWPDFQVAGAVLMRFDLSNLPPGTYVDRATLNLYLDEADNDTSRVFAVSIHRIINVAPVIDAATGYTFDGVNSWTANSCCADDVPMAQADIASADGLVPINSTVGPKSFSVAAVVQYWIDRPTKNFGLLLNSDTSLTENHYRYFASNENGSANKRPHLVVEFTPEGTLPPVTIEDAQCQTDEYLDRIDGQCKKPEPISCRAGAGRVDVWMGLVLLVGWCGYRRCRRAMRRDRRR